MTKPKKCTGIAYTDSSLSMPARTVYAWLSTTKPTSVTIAEVMSAMDFSRFSASAHLNALEKAGHLVRFLPNGGKAEHHWRLSNEQ